MSEKMELAIGVSVATAATVLMLWLSGMFDEFLSIISSCDSFMEIVVDIVLGISISLLMFFLVLMAVCLLLEDGDIFD